MADTNIRVARVASLIPEGGQGEAAPKGCSIFAHCTFGAGGLLERIELFIKEDKEEKKEKKEKEEERDWERSKKAGQKGGAEEEFDPALSKALSSCLIPGKVPIEPPPFRMDSLPGATPFRLRVWRKVMGIPAGTVVTYGELARKIGCPSPQAVGQALKANPIPILIPCHRVVSSDGGLGGFSAGTEIKALLLRLEGSP